MDKYILEGIYLEIILVLIGEKYKIRSLIKLVFMAFCIKNEKKSSYGTRKRDFIDAFLDNINMKLVAHPEEFKAILEVIYKLKTSGWITVENDLITPIKKFDDIKCENKFLTGCMDKPINPICEVNKLDSKAFIEEVLRHV